MKKPCKFIVSVDPIVLLRASGPQREPDPVHYALQAELAGAAGIRAHLRVDRRHLLEEDVELLNRQVKTQFYLQLSPHQDIVHLIHGVRPKNIILTAEHREERTRETGLDVALLANELQGIIHNVDTDQTRVFLFIDPDLDQVKAAAKLQAHGIIVNVADLMVEHRGMIRGKKLAQIKDAVRLSNKFGMETHLSNGIRNYCIPELVSINGVDAIHVGHQLAAHALQVGIFQAVRSFLHLM